MTEDQQAIIDLARQAKAAQDYINGLVDRIKRQLFDEFITVDVNSRFVDLIQVKAQAKAIEIIKTQCQADIDSGIIEEMNSGK